MIRTFRLTAPHMKGDDIEGWQRTVLAQLKTWGVNYPLVADGDYGAITRDATATVLYGLGIDVGKMSNGITGNLRVRVRNKRLTVAERARFAARLGWRRRLRDRFSNSDVHSPLGKILSSSWGYHPPVHDGVDLICKANAPLLAICKAKVIRADAGGWWGKGAPSPAIAAKGDGIIVLRCLTDTGPFRKGLNFGYGHAEHPRVRVGDTVQAGEHIGTAGMANAWHIHMVVNGRSDAKGVGDRDPMVYVRYAVKHS